MRTISSQAKNIHSNLRLEMDEIPDEIPNFDELIDEQYGESELSPSEDEFVSPQAYSKMSIYNSPTAYSDLEGLNRPFANFRRMHMPFVNINSSELPNSNFELANMVCASICLSHLHGSNFRYADLEYTEISKSDFTSADFSHSLLRGARIKDCDFRWADLRGADLSECSIYSSRFQNALIDAETILPFSKHEAKRMGMVWVAETSKAG